MWHQLLRRRRQITALSDFFGKDTLSKKLKYEKAASVAPENYFPFVVAGWHYPDDNGGNISTATNDIRIQGQIQMYYKDA